MRRFLRWLFAGGLVLGLVAGGGLALAWWRYVVEDPGPGFTRDEIEAIIAQESPVFARDGETRIGVFFDQEHRSYVPYAELPRAWVQAIVAAEDADFWEHPGFSPKHILRAVRDNARAGRVVAGGSTLTQQTAKNLFYRPDRSWRAKIEELVNALRLEAHFSKEDILEFYANQFHVSANGRGLGIAARYFFDKAPGELSLKECAFLAGLVKAPATYNPFVGGTEERREAARRAAEDRTAYVLRRMEETGAISAEERRAALDSPLVFRRGSFQYDRSVVVDEVARRLDDPDFVQLFALTGIDNPSTAGIGFVTTIDPVAQREAEYALVHHLSELGPRLEGPIDPRLSERSTMTMAPGVALVDHEVGVARVVAFGDEGGRLDFGGRPCVVDAEANRRLAGIVGEPVPARLPPGTMVLASVRAGGPDARCDVEVRPELQGAVVVLEAGEIRAMVGGTENRNFNRAMAPRQLGSTWKPVIYAAALQLGWLPTDPLDNRPAVFPFRGVWYAPGADHDPAPWVTMSVAGARSENIASVWLLAHLVDRLNDEQFRRVATLAGIWPQENEPPSAWIARLGAEGIRSGEADFEAYAYARAVADVAGGLAFGAHPEDALSLRSVPYGAGVLEQVEKGKLSADLAATTFLGMEALLARCEAEAFATEACGGAPSLEPIVDENGLLLPPPAPDPLLGRLHRSTLVELRTRTDELRKGFEGRDPWDPELLALNADLRQLVGIRYVHRLAAALGVQAELPTGLSLPLGAADVSLVEMTALYAGLATGEARDFEAVAFLDSGVVGLRERVALPVPALHTALVGGVRGRDGADLYRLDASAVRVADPVAGEALGDILRNVVRIGTGRRAAGAASVGGIPLPLAGKTGTTNDYRNAAFVGFAPVVDGEARWGRAWTVGVYVGYDDNRPMRTKGLRVQGASGPLPVWMATVRGLAEAGLLGSVGAAEYAHDPARFTVVEGEAPILLPSGPEGPERRFAPMTDPAAVLPASVEVLPLPSEAAPGEAEDPAAPVRISPAEAGE